MMAPTGDIGRGAGRAAGRTRDRAKEKATVDKGLMRNSIISERLPDPSPFQIVHRIGSDVFYAIYQELGTGPIFARRAPLLVFQIDGRWIATYSTKGVPAVHFLGRSIAEVTARDFLL